MNEEYSVKSIGRIHADEQGFRVVIDEPYRAALKGLEDFGCVQLLWWFSGCDNDKCRNLLVEAQPYTKGPKELGVFATRSPQRPNPLALTTAFVSFVDEQSGTIGLEYIDAFDGSPVLDVKPYTPSVDRVESPTTPDWCAHWPANVETSGDFDWQAEFNF